MSEQSPWGVPPPSDPSPTPPWGGGPPSYGVPLHQSPQGPQGPRKRTGLVVAAVAAVLLLVVGAFGITLAVVGGDDADADRAATGESTASDPTGDPTDSPTDSPTRSTAPEGEGDVIGDGYGYDLPATGWREASDDAQELAESIDTAIILGSSIEVSQSSIVVESLSTGMASSLEQLEDLWKRNLEGTDDATTVDIAETSIAGERAIGVRIDDRVNAEGVPIKQIAYLVLHENRQYSIALSYPRSGDVTSKGDFEKMLASWSWTN